jgi:hypothetical protein
VFPSFHTIIVLFLSAVQSISSTALSVIHIYKQTVNTIKRVHNSPHAPPQPAARTSPYVSEDDTRLPESASPPETPSTPSFPTPSDSVVASLVSHPINAGTPQTTVSAPPSSLSSPPNLARPGLFLIAELLSLRSRFTGAALLFLCDALIGTFASFFDRYAE